MVVHRDFHDRFSTNKKKLKKIESTPDLQQIEAVSPHQEQSKQNKNFAVEQFSPVKARAGQRRKTRKKTKLDVDQLGESYNISDNKVYENIQILPKPENMEDYEEFLGDSIRKIKIFSQLEDDQIKELIKNLFYCQNIPSEKFIFTEETRPSSFFIIDTGKLAVVIQGSEKKILARGVGFGELALLYNKPRSASIGVKSKKVFMWGLSRVNFRIISEKFIVETYKKVRKFVEEVELFKNLLRSQKDSLCHILKTVSYYENDIIVKKAEELKNLYFVKDGEAAEIYDGQLINKFKEKQYFGTKMYLKDMKTETKFSTSTFIAYSDKLELLICPKKELKDLFGLECVQETINLNIIRAAIEKHKILEVLSCAQKEKLALGFGIETSEKGNILLEYGQVCEYIFIMLEGTLVYKLENDEIEGYDFVHFETHDIFGLDFAYPDKEIGQKCRGYLEVESSTVTFAKMKISEIPNLLSGTLQKTFRKRTLIVKQMTQKSIRKILMNENIVLSNMKVKNLEIVVRKQKAYFGQFYITRDLVNSQIYLMKHISFLEIKRKKAYPFVVKEKDLLSMIKSHQIETNEHHQKNHRDLKASMMSIEIQDEGLINSDAGQGVKIHGNKPKKNVHINGVYVTMMFPLQTSFLWENSLFFMYAWSPSYPLYKLILKKGNFASI